MTTESLKLALLIHQANAAYQPGMNRQAADLYQQAAELALQDNRIDLHVHCLRWTGNSYMWSFLHPEAYPHLLHAVSYHEHPQARPEDIYCALTDLCLLSIRSRGITEIRGLISQSRAYLERRNLLHWGHRLDRLEAMLNLRLGDFAQAHQLASRGWIGMNATKDGPRYQKGAYLDALFRSAHGLGDRQEMDRAVELFRACDETDISTSHVRQLVCLGMRFAFDGVTDKNRETIRDLAREALHIIQNATSPFEESTEAIRLLLLCGEADEARNAVAHKPPPNLAETALLRLDLLLAQLPELAGWQPPFYRRDFRTGRPEVDQQRLSTATANELNQHITSAGEQARAEDARLGCDLNSRAVELRKGWLAALSPTQPCAIAA
jgi:hypothetical protein